jgi:MoaA/NifB/PqqE/SkfB family radical SAM enzyme
MSEQKFCPKPFEHFELHENGKAYLCCPSYIFKKDIGSFRTDGFEEVWNSPSAKEFRRSIIDGSFEFCDSARCPILSEGKLRSLSELKPETREAIVRQDTAISYPSSVVLVNDFSCNLSCPSCRSTNINYPAGSEKQIQKERETRSIIQRVLEGSRSKVVINITGSGDPFGSVSYKKILEELDGSLHPNLIIELQTNGVLLTPRMWEKLAKIHRNIRHISISVDAANKQTYDQLRPGGSWEKLLANIKFISQQRAEHKFFLCLNFVVQETNVDQIVDFVKLFRFQAIDEFQLLTINDWGAMSPEDFAKTTVWELGHPKRQQLIAQLVHPFLDGKPIVWGTLYPLREEFMPSRSQIFTWRERLRVRFENFTAEVVQWKEYPRRQLLKQHFAVISAIRSLGSELMERERLNWAKRFYALSRRLTRDDFDDNYCLGLMEMKQDRPKVAAELFCQAYRKHFIRPRVISQWEVLRNVFIACAKVGDAKKWEDIRREALVLNREDENFASMLSTQQEHWKVLHPFPAREGA